VLIRVSQLRDYDVVALGGHEHDPVLGRIPVFRRVVRVVSATEVEVVDGRTDRGRVVVIFDAGMVELC
jgi:hypothetical protein